MKRYNKEEREHLVKDGFELWDAEYYPRIAYKEDIYRVGNSKAGYYVFEIAEEISYKKAYEMMKKLFSLKGISKKDLEGMSTIIETSVEE